MYILLYFSSNTSIAYTKSLHYLAQKEKRTLFLPIFITHSFTGVQQLLSIRVQRWKGSKGATRESKLPFCRSFVSLRSSVDAQSEIYRVPLSFETPPSAPGNNEPGCTFWSLRDPIASLPCYPAVLSKQYAPLAACLRINREHAPLFHPREATPSPSSFKALDRKLSRLSLWIGAKKIGPLSTIR